MFTRMCYKPEFVLKFLSRKHKRHYRLIKDQIMSISNEPPVFLHPSPVQINI